VMELIDPSYRNLAALPSLASCTRDVYAEDPLQPEVALRMAGASLRWRRTCTGTASPMATCTATIFCGTSRGLPAGGLWRGVVPCHGGHPGNPGAATHRSAGVRGVAGELLERID
jgi:hypothetical protein